MLHPKEFRVNQAWIAFRLNSSPIQTEIDGDFNCMALMDAASCFLLGTEFFPASAAEPTQRVFRRLLKQARSHKPQLPKKLYFSSEAVTDEMIHEATRQKIEVVRVPESELLIFIAEARMGFNERFG